MLEEKQIAPEFILPRLGGGEIRFSDSDRISLLVFYKFSCPTCQLALPYIQKMYEAFGDAFQFLAIAQDGVDKTEAFVREYGLTMPVVMDEAPYPISSKYQLVSVPSIFLVNPDRTIRYSGAGFVKQDLFNLADVLSEKSGRPQIELFGSESVPEFKPG